MFGLIKSTILLSASDAIRLTRRPDVSQPLPEEAVTPTDLMYMGVFHVESMAPTVVHTSAVQADADDWGLLPLKWFNGFISSAVQADADAGAVQADADAGALQADADDRGLRGLKWFSAFISGLCLIYFFLNGFIILAPLAVVRFCFMIPRRREQITCVLLASTAWICLLLHLGVVSWIAHPKSLLSLFFVEWVSVILFFAESNFAKYGKKMISVFSIIFEKVLGSVFGSPQKAAEEHQVNEGHQVDENHQVMKTPGLWARFVAVMPTPTTGFWDILVFERAAWLETQAKNLGGSWEQILHLFRSVVGICWGFAALSVGIV